MPDENDPKLAATPEFEKAPEPVKRRSREFGKALVAKLPKLGVSQWDKSDTLNVYQDMQGIVDLDADAFLQPLEAFSEQPHGER